MNRHFTSIVCVGTTLLFSACASDDPNQGGFIGGLIGLGSGAYGERVAAEQMSLELEEERYQVEADGREDLDRTLGERRTQAEDLKERVAFVKQQVGNIKTEIRTLRQMENVTLEQVETAESDVAELLDNIDRIETERAAHEQAEALLDDNAEQHVDAAESAAPPGEEITDLRAYIEELQEAVDALKSTRARRLEEATAASSGTN